MYAIECPRCCGQGVAADRLSKSCLFLERLQDFLSIAVHLSVDFRGTHLRRRISESFTEGRMPIRSITPLSYVRLHFILVLLLDLATTRYTIFGSHGCLSSLATSMTVLEKRCQRWSAETWFARLHVCLAVPELHYRSTKKSGVCCGSPQINEANSSSRPARLQSIDELTHQNKF